MLEDEPLRVLVIEDDADTRANLTDILELDGHRVQTAECVADALARAEWTDSSIILLDRKLPDGTAEEVLPRIKSLAPAAEVLVVTGYRDLEGALACLRQGAADYILKPVNSELLRASLQRVAHQRRLAQQLKLLATAVRDVKEGILITDALLDPPGPRILFVNEALSQLTGYSAEELLGQTPRIFQSPRTDRILMERFRDKLQRGEAFTGEMLNRRKDGTEYFVELHVAPVFDPSGRITNYVSTQRDVTARKRAEERVLQAERLAAIGQMITGLAHESRNALQRSKACLEMLALEVEDRPSALDLVGRVQKAQDHLHHLYEEVRSYAAPLRLRREKANLADIWREVWLHLDVLRDGKDVKLKENIRPDTLELILDPFAMGQVFRNIFENAIAACPEPGEVAVHTEPAMLQGRPVVQIAVRDNGPGLSAEQKEHIFDPFFTTKTKGTGLGMAIAKRIVEAHGGQIAACIAESGGAEIRIVLPKDETGFPLNGSA